MIRRTASIILFVIGGWMLMSEVVIAWIDVGKGLPAEFAATGIMLAFALPFLLLGTWTSPGKRSAELGLTLMISAGIGAVAGVMAVMMFADPTFRQAMPPEQKMPNFALAPIFGLLNLLIIAAGGFLLRRWSLGRAKDSAHPLEEVFE